MYEMKEGPGVGGAVESGTEVEGRGSAGRGGLTVRDGGG